MFTCFIACNNGDEVGFSIPVEFRKDLNFRAIPGGAIMEYYLPDNSDIFGVQVVYSDVRGNKVTKFGSYLSDTLALTGFNEARKNVPALISFLNNEMIESSPIEVTFDTEDSAPIAFFDSLNVTPFWGGFSVSYVTPETVNGMVHIFYIGTNPLTNQPDSIWMMSTPIIEGGDTLNFQIQQKQETTAVVVRTEDYQGYRVKQEIREVPCLVMDTLNSSDFDFRFTGEVVENNEYQFGTKYLFDNDEKGMAFRKNRQNNNPYKYSTFLAGPNAFGERFIIDLRESQIPAAVKLYAFVNFQTTWPYEGSYWEDYPAFLIQVWDESYAAKLPCKIKLYGTNDNPETVDLASCALLFNLDDDPSRTTWKKSWAKNTDDIHSQGEGLWSKTDAEIEAVDPVCLDMLCNYSGNSYRYLIFVVEDTYDGELYNASYEKNRYEYITFSELKVCVKAE